MLSQSPARGPYISLDTEQRTDLITDDERALSDLLDAMDLALSRLPVGSSWTPTLRRARAALCRELGFRQLRAL